MRPVRREAAVAWELRGAWAGLREVVVVWADGRMRGYVVHVASTDAYALLWTEVKVDTKGRRVLGERHVPLEIVLAVRRPHHSAPEDGVAVTPPPPPEPIITTPGQLSFDDLPGVARSRP